MDGLSVANNERNRQLAEVWNAETQSLIHSCGRPVAMSVARMMLALTLLREDDDTGAYPTDLHLFVNEEPGEHDERVPFIREVPAEVCPWCHACPHCGEHAPSAIEAPVS